jgi:hypothetical protein
MRALIGTQVAWAADVLRARRRPVDAGGSRTAAVQRAELAGQYTRLIMQVIVSVVVLAFSLIFLVRSENAQAQKAGFSLIGTIIGYWLR